MVSMIGQPRSKKGLRLAKMSGKRRMEQFLIGRKHGRFERVEVGHALNGLTGEFAFMSNGVSAVTLGASKRP